MLRAPPHRQAGMLFSLLTAAQWGLVPILLKALQPQLGSPTLIWFRLIVPAFVVGAYCIIARRKMAWRPLLTARNFLLLAITIGGFIGNYVFFMLGLQHITPDASQVVGQLGPLLLLVGGVFIFKEPFTPLQWIGLATAIIGMGLFFHHALMALQLNQYVIGLLWITVAACSWGAFGLAHKALSRSVHSQQSLLIIYIIGAAIFFPSAEFTRLPALDGFSIAMLVWMSLSTALAYVTLAAGMARWDAARVSAVLTTTPLFAIGFAAALAHQLPNYVHATHLDLLSTIGALLLVAGSGVAALARR